jgi:prepilin-type N-terminal cleavage/methylation domain-containing protein
MRHMKSKNQNGFTILELMIATTILSVILLLASVVMIGIGNLYFKGLTQVKVQTSTRDVVDDLVSQLQQSNQSVDSIVYDYGLNPLDGNHRYLQAVCINSTRYTFVTNTQIGETGTNGSTTGTFQHILWRDSSPNNFANNGSFFGSCPPANLLAANPSSGSFFGGADLVGPNTLINPLYTDGTNSPLVSSVSPYIISLNLDYGAYDLLNLSGSTVTCKGGVGDKFCATSSLTTTVVQRLQ